MPRCSSVGPCDGSADSCSCLIRARGQQSAQRTDFPRGPPHVSHHASLAACEPAKGKVRVRSATPAEATNVQNRGKASPPETPPVYRIEAARLQQRPTNDTTLTITGLTTRSDKRHNQICNNTATNANHANHASNTHATTTTLNGQPANPTTKTVRTASTRSFRTEMKNPRVEGLALSPSGPLGHPWSPPQGPRVPVGPHWSSP
jgi:hypothetical protein